MREQELKRLEKLYPESQDADQHFNSAIGADIPSARKLAKTIFAELNEITFGIPFLNDLPVQERILISDYLYQCASSIETNLVEAKLHYFEWLDYSQQISRRYADVVSVRNGQIDTKMPPSTTAIDDLPNAFEKLHVCGFFRAIGSAFDCLGGTIIGTLGLPCSLRKSDLGSARRALKKLDTADTPGKKLQLDFGTFLESVLTSGKCPEWLGWAMQYRNMFVHRGRRMSVGTFAAKEPLLYDGDGNVVPRVETVSHLSIDPDLSEIEAMISSRTIVLNERAEVTLDGIFKNSRDSLESVCERLLKVWTMRKTDPPLISQPATQWKADFKNSDFGGFQPDTEPLSIDAIISNPIMKKRLMSAAALDPQRHLWKGSDWEKFK